MASNRVVPNHSLNLDHNGKMAINGHNEIHVHVLEQHSRLTKKKSLVQPLLISLRLIGLNDSLHQFKCFTFIKLIKSMVKALCLYNPKGSFNVHLTSYLE